MVSYNVVAWRSQPLLALKSEPQEKSILRKLRFESAALSAVPSHLGLPAFLSDPRLSRPMSHRGFAGDFYAKMAHDWNDAVTRGPSVRSVIPLPPLVAIVLDRSNSRASIPETIVALREELQPVRNEMAQFEGMLRGGLPQKEIEDRLRFIEESFEATFKASRHPKTVLLPLLKLYKNVRSPLDTIIKYINPDYQPSNPRFVASRTATGRAFMGLLDTDSMHTLVSHFLSLSEVRNIQHSLEHE